ncbi:MAG: thioesterase family protein [Caloramator sp.]|nr:thioesterase family protein [Caloramator sp.]
MKEELLDKIKVGLNSVIETTVQEKDSAANYVNGFIDVLSTPSLIGLLECAAKNAVDLHLPTGYSTVGIRVDVKHLAATPIGMKVKAMAELIEVDGKRLVFKIEAYDEKEKIMEGLHERFIVDVEKFMQKIKDKAK